ncbi:MAG: hypothetical protein K2X91_04405, partial [Thermoleophilia bacterium]|nr:hypothetical protein [Thermoleophilia bacterium]
MSSPLFDGLGPIAADDGRAAAASRGPGAKRVVCVALPVPLDRVFDYTTDDPAALAAGPETALVGRRVRVGFGGQKLVGLVVPGDLRGDDAAHEGREARGLAPIEEILDEEPVVGEDLIRVLAEEARAIFCPIGQAIAHALPPGATPRLSRPYALTRLGERALAQGALGGGALGGDARPILERLSERPSTLA